MRRMMLLPLVAVLAVVAAGCGGSSKSSSGTTGSGSSGSACSKSQLALVKKGQLTIGTDNPAYPPWYGGSAGHGWKVSDPYSGKGYESAVAYAVAKQLGFSRAQVHWSYVPFGRAFAPGPKSFDFDINQISYNPARAKAVAFSNSYYDVNQSIVVNKGTPIASAKTTQELRSYKLGAQLGTTSYGYIVTNIQPTKKPAVFPTNAGAVQALKNKQIDGLVVDLPTAFYVTSAQVPNSEVLGQFPAPAGGEHFGMVFAKSSKLVPCVNKALATLRSNGTLQQLHQQWLAKATGAPTLK